jgi:hypothetical protein
MSPTPDLEVVARPLQGVHASLAQAERKPISVSGATLVAILAGSIIVTVGGFDEGGRHIRRLDCALTNDGGIVGMGGISIELEGIPILHDVNLSLRGPWVTKHPERRPSSTCWRGQMREVSNEEAVVVGC